MTIFFEFVQTYLKEKLQVYISESKTKPATGRNAELSQRKREIAEELIKLIDKAEVIKAAGCGFLKADVRPSREERQQFVNSKYILVANELFYYNKLNDELESIDLDKGNLTELQQYVAKAKLGDRLSNEQLQKITFYTIQHESNGRPRRAADGAVICHIHDSDVMTQKVLDTWMDDCKAKAVAANEALGGGEGALIPLIDIARDWQARLLRKLIANSLANIPFEGQPAAESHPFYVFRWKMVQYFDKKIQEALGKWRVRSAWDYLTGLAEIPVEKEAVIRAALVECEQDLDGLNKKHKDYQHNVRKTVIKSLGDLQKQNSGVGSGHGVKLDVPIPFSFGMFKLPIGSIQPSDGCLGECIVEAMKIVDPAQPIAQQAETSTTTSARAHHQDHAFVVSGTLRQSTEEAASDDEEVNFDDLDDSESRSSPQYGTK